MILKKYSCFSRIVFAADICYDRYNSRQIRSLKPYGEIAVGQVGGKGESSGSFRILFPAQPKSTDNRFLLHSLTPGYDSRSKAISHRFRESGEKKMGAGVILLLGMEDVEIQDLLEKAPVRYDRMPVLVSRRLSLFFIAKLSILLWLCWQYGLRSL